MLLTRKALHVCKSNACVWALLFITSLTNWSALHVAASVAYSPEVLKVLVEHGANLTAKCQRGMSSPAFDFEGNYLWTLPGCRLLHRASALNVFITLKVS